MFANSGTKAQIQFCMNELIFCLCSHFLWANLKDLKLYSCTQKACVSQIWFTHLSKSVLVSTWQTKRLIKQHHYCTGVVQTGRNKKPTWHQQTAHPYNTIHATCHRPCTVKTRICLWRARLSKVRDTHSQMSAFICSLKWVTTMNCSQLGTPMRTASVWMSFPEMVHKDRFV